MKSTKFKKWGLFLFLGCSLFACFNKSSEKAPAVSSKSEPRDKEVQKNLVQHPPTFKKVIQIILENTNADLALKQPFLAKLAKDGASLTDFHGVTHPSQANYIALTSGDKNGFSGDEFKTVDVLNIVDLLEAKGKSWKLYAENYPGNCFLGSTHGPYARKHAPLISYANVQNNPARCANVVNASQLDKDIEADRLPEYSLYIPNLNNDGHDTGVEFASRWLGREFGPRFTNPKFMADLLVVVTFDESTDESNLIYTVLLGDSVNPGQTSNEHYTAYNILRTIEDQFGLGTLGKNDEQAKPITGVWK